MADEIEKHSVVHYYSDGSVNVVEEPVARESWITIILNNRELVTLLCSPADLKYLAVGFLFSEGLIKSKDEIKQVLVDDQRGTVRVNTVEDKELASDFLFKRLITSGCGGNASFYRSVDAVSEKVESQVAVSPEEITSMVSKFQHSSESYLKTHGIHSAVLSDGKDFLAFGEDIGRHNAVDKVLGKCLLGNISTHDRILVISGRVSSEILHKAAKASIPVIASISVPTDLGIMISAELGITLIGSVKGKRFKVYANELRVVSRDQEAAIAT